MKKSRPLLMGKKQDVAEIAKKVMKKLKEVERDKASNCQSPKTGRKKRAR